MITDDEIDRVVSRHLDGLSWPDDALDVQRIRRRVSGRRNIRVGAAAAVGGVAVVFVGLVTSMARDGDPVMTAKEPTPSATSVAGSPGPSNDPGLPVVPAPRPSVACGRRMPTIAGPSLYVGTDVQVAPRDVKVNAIGDTYFPITITLANPTKSRLKGVIGEPRTAVVRDGVVVALADEVRASGRGVELAPGESSGSLSSGIPLTACAGDPLPPGRYQYYAWTGAHWEPGIIGTTPPFGGPWNLDITAK